MPRRLLTNLGARTRFRTLFHKEADKSAYPLKFMLTEESELFFQSELLAYGT